MVNRRVWRKIPPAEGQNGTKLSLSNAAKLLINRRIRVIHPYNEGQNESDGYHDDPDFQTPGGLSSPLVPHGRVGARRSGERI